MCGMIDCSLISLRLRHILPPEQLITKHRLTLPFLSSNLTLHRLKKYCISSINVSIRQVLWTFFFKKYKIQKFFEIEI